MARDDRPGPRDDRNRPDAVPAPSRRSRDAPPAPVRAAGVLVGLQALAAAAFTAALVVRAGSTTFGVGPVLGQAGFFLIITATIGAVAAGLVVGRRWARTPAIVAQLLLLPVVYSLIGPSRQVVLGLATGALVFATFMLLINERSRAWSMGLDPGDR